MGQLRESEGQEFESRLRHQLDSTCTAPHLGGALAKLLEFRAHRFRLALLLRGGGGGGGGCGFGVQALRCVAAQKLNLKSNIETEQGNHA
jgi:hypothetical protein